MINSRILGWSQIFQHLFVDKFSWISAVPCIDSTPILCFELVVESSSRMHDASTVRLSHTRISTRVSHGPA